jgi:hypothetical protein
MTTTVRTDPIYTIEFSESEARLITKSISWILSGNRGLDEPEKELLEDISIGISKALRSEPS